MPKIVHECINCEEQKQACIWKRTKFCSQYNSCSFFIACCVYSFGSFHSPLHRFTSWTIFVVFFFGSVCVHMCASWLCLCPKNWYSIGRICNNLKWISSNLNFVRHCNLHRPNVCYLFRVSFALFFSLAMCVYVRVWACLWIWVCEVSRCVSPNDHRIFWQQQCHWTAISSGLNLCL